MIIRSRAPLRLGLAGGGTDLSPYCDQHGGAVLNATINMFAYCTIEPMEGRTICFESQDMGEVVYFDQDSTIAYEEIQSNLKLHIAVYLKINEMFGNVPSAFKMFTYNEAPVGSGLGGSSTMVVAMLKAYVEWLNIPLGEYDIARLAWEIERVHLKLSGGKQDQYAATFGGFNFIEFGPDNKVIVNPLRVKNWIRNELEDSLILYYTGRSRDSSTIIEQQIKGMRDHEKKLESMHDVKAAAFDMKEAVLTGRFDKFSEALHRGWLSKKMTSDVISNPHLEEIYQKARDAGALSGKLSGAGGGGFFMFYVDPAKRVDVIKALEKQGGKVYTTQFTKEGTQGWTIR